MKSNKGKKGFLWVLILFGLGVLIDTHFFHDFISKKLNRKPEEHNLFELSPPTQRESVASVYSKETISKSDAENLLKEKRLTDTIDNKADGTISKAASISKNEKDSFFVSLSKCAPEISARPTITTPEALLNFLQENIGVEKKETSIENFHLTLRDGSLRRIHIVTADNTNSVQNQELRFFKVDSEGYPERISLNGDETLQSLLSQGTVTKHEAKVLYVFKDGAIVTAETHNQAVYELQFNNRGRILSCRHKKCVCSSLQPN